MEKRVDGRGFEIRGATPRRSCDEARNTPERETRICWAGYDVGRWTSIIVFISTTRAAILMSGRRKVSNWAKRYIERLGIDTRRPHMSQ